MKLDRNTNADKRGKYALLKLRALADCADVADPFQELPPKITGALETLEDAGILDWGPEGSESEFFVIRLKDQFAGYALRAYAEAAAHFNQDEYASEIFSLAERAGPRSKFCKLPD